MLRAIAFDLWETLITNTPEVSRRQRKLRLERIDAVLASGGHAAAAAELERAYHASWARCQELYWSADRDVPCRRQVELLLESLGMDPAAARFIEELEEAYAGVAADVLPVVVDGALEVLGGLRARGLRIGLISNTGRTPGYALRRILASLDLAPLIDVMVFSNEHGECKPRRSIFEALRAGLGVEFSELVFVGDNLYVDVHGAQRCGMRAIHYDPGVRGTAIAPAVDHGLDIVPDAKVRTLAEIVPMVDKLLSC